MTTPSATTRSSDPRRVVVFDVNETLSDMSPMSLRFTEIGAPAHLARLWFTSLLRDGFALTAADTQESFAVIGEQSLRIVLADLPLNRNLDEAVEHVMNGFRTLRTHSDVPDGVPELRASGRRWVTLSNGSTSIAEQLFTDAGIRDEFEALLSAEDAGAWKPARVAYEYAARQCHTTLEEMLLVAVHPWDIDGAARAGMATAWINRTPTHYPTYFSEQRYTTSTIGQLAERLSDH